eukprot:gene8828-biopygen8980
MLADFCEINGMLSQAQEGSREKRNTMRQLTRITNAIEDANLSKQELHATYIDFENAYGSVDHVKLIATLRHLGVPAQLTEAIKDILGEEEEDSIQMRAKGPAKETLPIMKQLGNARRVYTDAEMEGTTRTNKYLRKMDEEYRDPQEQPMTTGSEKLGAVNVIKETRTEQATKEINFTKQLTLLKTYPDLKDLTTADGKKALPIEALKATGGRAHGNKTVQKITQGMLHLYPYIRLEDQEREEDDMMGEWNPPERTDRRPIQRETGKWANQEDPMEAPGREGTHAPTRILASRQYLDNYADPDSKVIQYETQWTDSEWNILGTWSTEETIRMHLLAHNLSSDQGWEELVDEWERTTQGKRTKREPEDEILAGKPSKDTGNGLPTWRQLRTEGDITYCYEPDGSLIGTLSAAKARELYDRYASEVGNSAVQRPTWEQLAKRLKLKLEHKIHVDTVEEEIAQLLIRYSSKAEMKHRKINLQNHWTLPPEMMEAVHEVMGARTEVFASPLNVHKNTRPYYSQHPRDSVFGAAGSAWEAQWEQLGAYQFNPEYTAEDLYGH